jgi:predicted nucleic-acid-binding protein
MIAIDTNVLLRYLLDDDAVQSKKANKLINNSNQVLVTDVVLVETIWTLKGKKYNLGKEGIIGVIQRLFEERNICFEDGQAVWCALNDYRKPTVVNVSGKKKLADFSDALIFNKSLVYAQRHNETLTGCYTFDVAAQQLPNARKP